MTNKEYILEALENKPNGICDDCLSVETNIQPRQQVNQICNKLLSAKVISRQEDLCPNCKSLKFLNAIVLPVKEIVRRNAFPKSNNTELTMSSKDIKNEYVKVRVNKLVANLGGYIDYFKTDNTFSGPSDYFYGRIVSTIKDDPEYDTIFKDDFIELLYATLASWGMHRMGPDNKGAKMNEFKPFKDCIMSNKDKFMALKSFELNKIELNEKLKHEIEDLYRSLVLLMKSNSKLVATSKIMHFILPKLVAPMDRQYTMQFFDKKIPTVKSSEDFQEEIELFHYIFAEMHAICRSIDCNKFLDKEISPSVPKVIDNAIVGFVRKELSRPRISD